MKIQNYDNMIKTDKKDEEKKNKHQYIVQHSFFKNISRVLIAGPSGSGKTNALIEILLKPLIYYEQIYIYTKTPDQDKMKSLDKLFTKIAKDAKITPFHKITNDPVPNIETFEKEKFKIIVFDDMMTEDKKTLNTITKYFILGRHHRISPIFLSQSYYSTPKSIRINCSHFLIFNVGTKREVRSILADHTNITEQQYHNNTQEHDFISINKIEKTVTRNLDEPLE